MQKILTNSKFVIILVIFCLIISTLSFYRYTTYKNFEIQKSKDGLLVLLKNRNYLILNHNNDVINDGKAFEVKPFDSNASPNFSYLGVDFASLNKQSIEKMKINEATRTVKISVIDSQTINYIVDIKTDYPKEAKAKYTIQFDYSGNSSIYRNDKGLVIQDRGCEIIFESENDQTMTDYADGKSVRISKSNSDNVSFIISMKVNCT